MRRVVLHQPKHSRHSLMKKQTTQRLAEATSSYLREKDSIGSNINGNFAAKYNMMKFLGLLFICQVFFSATILAQASSDVCANSVHTSVDNDTTEACRVSAESIYGDNPRLDANRPIATEGRRNGYTFRSEISFASLPWIAVGLLSKEEKKVFRMARQQFVHNFHNRTDDFLQYSPLLLATALKLAGVEGRSNTSRYLFSAAASYAIMAGIVNATKYTVRELRPDGSTRNSFPSGHTATAFAAATILHKEYGLTRNPIYSIAGYTVATTTACMRVLNNRHWVSDVFAGAGIGILSVELGYAISNLIFKEKGIEKADMTYQRDFIRNPSFVNIQMALGFVNQQLNMPYELNIGKDYDHQEVNRLVLGRSTTVGFEGAYFFNTHFGVGGRLRLNSIPVNNWPAFTKNALSETIINYPDVKEIIHEYTLSVGSDHLSEFTADAGIYLNWPLTPRLAIGSKLLLGRSYMRGIDINAHAKGKKVNIDVIYKEGEQQDPTYYLFPAGNPNSTNPDDFYDTTWDLLTVNANKTYHVSTGVSCTFAYKSLYSFRLFADLDYTRKTFSINYAPMLFLNKAVNELNVNDAPVNPTDFFQTATSQTKKHLLTPTVGAAFCISF